MEQIKIEGTSLRVLPLALGTANYGTSVNEREAFRQLDTFFEAGGRLLDTALVYGQWVEKMGSASEKLIGRWLNERGNREQLVLCTKGGHPQLTSMGVSRLSRREVASDLERSLEQLQTGTIDLYLLHRDDESLPVAQLIEMMQGFIKEGRIRYYGLSNWSAARLEQAIGYAKETGQEGPVVNQLMYSLADINASGLPDPTMVPMDRKTYDLHARTKCSVMAYSALAKGFFARKMNGSQLPPSLAALYENESNTAILERIRDLAKEGSYSPLELSVMYHWNERGFTSIPICSFSSVEQLQQVLSCLEKTVPTGLLEELSKLKRFVLPA